MKPIRLLAVLEANTLTGPAKNLLQFASCARSIELKPSIEVAVALFERAGTPSLLHGIAERMAIPVYVIRERARFDFSVLAQLRSAARDYRADVIQTHSVKSHFLIRRTGLDRTVPWVAFHHGYTWPDLKMRLYNQLDRWSLRTAQLVLTVSDSFRRELMGLGIVPSRIQVVANAIEPHPGAAPEELARLRAACGIQDSEQVILSVGRLSAEKDHRTQVSAVRLLHDSSLRPHLLILGEGPERGRIEATVRKLGLERSVTLAGHVPSATPYYGIADVAVLSSLSEGSPNAVLEAMAARVPVVASSVGGVPEMITHQESGLLFKARDTQTLAHYLAEILSSRTTARRLAGNAFERVACHHSPASRTQRLVEVYAGLAGTPSG